jgi:hypothetical protein
MTDPLALRRETGKQRRRTGDFARMLSRLGEIGVVMGSASIPTRSEGIYGSFLQQVLPRITTFNWLDLSSMNVSQTSNTVAKL